MTLANDHRIFFIGLSILELYHCNMQCLVSIIFTYFLFFRTFS